MLSCLRNIAIKNKRSLFRNGYYGYESQCLCSDVRHRHVTKVRVEWRDLDPMNHVNNCAFFAFFENARIQVFQDQLGLDMSLKPSGLAPVISHTECRYLKQVRLPDELEIRTSVEGVEPERAQYKHKYECFSTSQQEVVAIGSATIVMLNFDGKSASRAPLSDDFVRKLTS